MKPAQFNVLSHNPQKLANFYRCVLNWRLAQTEKRKDRWLLESPQHQLNIYQIDLNRNTSVTCKKAEPLINPIGVDSIERVLTEFAAHGGSIASPKTAVPGIGYIASAKDPDGNIIAILQDLRRGSRRI